jgi:gamma-glutamylcyclotransferase (GGCT)/AIG2-like uncharacterized protein YtfP
LVVVLFLPREQLLGLTGVLEWAAVSVCNVAVAVVACWLLFLCRRWGSADSAAHSTAAADDAAASRAVSRAAAAAAAPTLLFVYGTLKRGCHWHSKHLSDARFVCEATSTEPLRLVLGECGVPYLLLPLPPSNETDDTDADADADADADTAQTATCRSLKRRGKGKRVRGELYVVSTETLAGIDEYEVRTREKNFLLRCVFN